MDSDAILSLQQQTEILLSQGGDDRLTIDSDLMNKYLSSTFPRPGVLRRGSCTCSTITSEVRSARFFSEGDYSSCWLLNSFPQGFEEATRLRELLLSQLLQEFSDREGLGCNDASVSQSVTAVMSAACNNIRQRLLSVMGFSGSNMASLITFPSGSDAEFLPLVVALIRSDSRGGKNRYLYLNSYQIMGYLILLEVMKIFELSSYQLLKSLITAPVT
jgi:hypothetical protein